MNEPEKRIVIMEVYGGCRNIRITDEGTYCAAYPHGGWEKLEPGACDHCQREKYLSGISRAEAIQALYRGFFRAKDRGVYTVKEMLAEGLDELIKEPTK